MASVSGQLLAALDNLVPDQLKRFKWHLRNDFSVSASDLVKVVDAPDTVDLMMARFGSEEAVKKTVDILRKMSQNLLAEELEKKHEQAQAENSREDPARVESESINETLPNIVPTTRNDLLQYSLRLSLDLNTVNNYVHLSENDTVISFTDTDQLYPDHPDRFDGGQQMLCRESVCGRSYWEVEWRVSVGISVSYKSISRKGGGAECWFGHNDQSWSLFCSPHGYSFWHNKIDTDLSVKPVIFRSTGEINDGFRRTGEFEDDSYRTNVYRTGVFVDPGAGTLSFFSVSRNTISLIHTVQTTFTQTLCPGIGLSIMSSVKLCF